ncbi:MG2 domain-containing protein [Flavobacterium tegetincola]|uniref:alpha-2-macroglobulin family protein n=1 Tax=Flavobacterium tegetincola TaxID=150172 RepID=UPI00042A0F8B|nr:MG2 domain-containing protein [Flavobacterium tegetincola]
MKKLLLFILFFTLSFGFAQDFQQEWREVIQFELDGKVKSASSLVDEIYIKAKRKNLEDQIIKCFFYQSKFLQIQDENAQTLIVKNIRAEIANSKFSKKALLSFIYATLLESHYQRNQYVINARTDLEHNSSLDFNTWTRKDFETEIAKIYTTLLKDDKQLHETPILKFGSIFEISPYTDAKKWSVYDFLQDKSLKYYFTNFNALAEKKAAKIIPLLLADASEFIKINADTISNEQLKSIVTIFQNNERYALQNSLKEIDALRYERMHRFSTFISDQKLYFSQLEILRENTSDSYLLQDLKVDFATFYNSITTKESIQNYHPEVLALIDEVLDQKENPNAKATAERLKESLLKKSLSINLAGAFYPFQNYRAFVSYKNVDTLKVSYYKIPVSVFKNLEVTNDYNRRVRNDIFDRDALVSAYIKQHQPQKTVVKTLPSKNNHFEYTTEILMDPMDVGQYLIYFETKNPYHKSKSDFAYKVIQVSTINFVQQKNNDFDAFNLLDRKTGKPIENAVVINEKTTVKSDKTGKARFILDSKGSTSTTDLLLIKEKDTLYTSYSKSKKYNTDDGEKLDSKAMVFFDRAIYRPGQKVFFKGYMFQNKNYFKSVVPNLTVHVIIEDANGDEVKTFDIQTNEFGSFTGEYVIPKNVLTGEFSITIEEPDNYEADSNYYNKKEDEHSFWDNANYSNYQGFKFQVEEYKRPTFEITFDKITANYTIGDTVIIKGNAKSLAGSNLTNVKVAYTLSKNIEMQDVFNPNEYKIVENETKTDEKGDFEIKFVAELEIGTNATVNVINYNLNVSITDLNGETRTATSRIAVGQEMLKLNCVIEPVLVQEDQNSMEIVATTLNDFPINAKGSITFIEQNASDFLIQRERFPELQSIEKKEFERLFPYEAYDKKDIEITEKEVMTINFDTEKSKVVDLSFLKKFRTANYKIILKANDQNGNEIVSDRTFELISKIKIADKKELFTYSQIESDASHFVFELKSVIPDLYITTRMYNDNKQESELVTQLKNGYGVVKISRKAKYRNDVHFHFSTLWENTYVEDQFSILKDDITNNLEFEIVSMRNKVEPGSLENWSFVLKNSKLQSEVLASMYDSSLDQFTTSDWKVQEFYKNRNLPEVIYQTEYWYNNTIQFRNLSFTSSHFKPYNPDPELNWFGFNFTDRSKYVNKSYLEKVQSIASIPANATMVSGSIFEKELPLPGAVVMIQGTTRGAQTDFDGRFTIAVAKGEVLVFSYLGFQNETAVYNGQKNFKIILQEDENKLEEVVVQGYDVVKTKRSLSLSSVTITSRPNASLLQTLQGQVAGLNIVSSSGQPGGSSMIMIRGVSSVNNDPSEPLYVVDGEIVTSEQFKNLNPDDLQTASILKDASATAIYGNRGANGVLIITTKTGMKDLVQVKTRTNFNETAFFYPNLTTDSKGNLNFSFTTPESLTKWRLRLFGHNKKAETGYFQTDIISQKDIMVMPNMPRFVREKDEIQFATKVVNMTNETKSGNAILLLFDAATNTAIDSITMNSDNMKVFNCKAKESVVVKWNVSIPEGVQGLRYKVIAKSGTVSDGEENILPVLTDKILITESIPIWVKGNTKREFTIENLKNNTSTTLQNHALTFEYTSNPVWIALQSLPYLMTYEHECSEQVFAKYYANCIAEKIISSHPQIEHLFKKWHDDKSVVSKLEMNEELKSIVLAETPWLLDTESDAEKNKRLAVLMDLNTLKQNNTDTFKKLEDKMLASGGFPWFSGGTEDRFISQHILAGIGHLNQLFPTDSLKYKTIVSKGIPNLDHKFVANNSKKEKIDRPSTLDLNYLYTRSFYLKNYPFETKTDSLIQLQLKQCKTDWLSYSLYEKGLLALIMNRFNEKDFAQKVITSLKETVSNNDEIGMYWIENNSGYGWYQSSIATQALLIEAFAEIDKDKETIDAMKVWLIKNKQTNRWSSTKSTTEAVFALMNQGSDWTSLKENTKIEIGDEKLFTQKTSNKEDEQNAGYLKIHYKSEEITPEMGSISIENKSDVPGFGGLYWQYFESLAIIKKDSTQTISIDKKLFKKVTTSKGEELIAITNETLKVGDLLTVRLIIKTENDLEFVHLKDLRASCLEPVDVISKHEWKGNFSYYKSTKDVSTNFFFDRLQKGTYVLEYDLRVTNQGNFNNGISTLQSMYAPEFSAHSENSKVIVKE